VTHDYRYQLTRNTHTWRVPEQVGPNTIEGGLVWEDCGYFDTIQEAFKVANDKSWVWLGRGITWNPIQLHPAPDWERMPTENGIEQLPPEYDYYSMDGNWHIYQHRIHIS
jgi:hypothetical protein